MTHLHRIETLILLPMALADLLLQRIDRALLPVRPLTALKVVELRTLARQQGLRSAGGRRIAQARRADLLAALA